MKQLVNTKMHESHGTNLRANIYREEDDGSYSVTYEMNGATVNTENYPGKSQQFVENTVSSWFSGVVNLNG